MGMKTAMQNVDILKKISRDYNLLGKVLMLPIAAVGLALFFLLDLVFIKDKP